MVGLVGGHFRYVNCLAFVGGLAGALTVFALKCSDDVGQAGLRLECSGTDWRKQALRLAAGFNPWRFCRVTQFLLDLGLSLAC